MWPRPHYMQCLFDFKLYIFDIFDISDILVSFETIFQCMTSRLIDMKDENKLKAEFSHLAQTYVNSFKPLAKDTKTHKVLKNLRKNSNIVVLKLDKGNGVVVANKTDYITGILDIINDTNKFAKLESDPTINREGSLQRFLRNLRKNGKIDKDMYTRWEKILHLWP